MIHYENVLKEFQRYVKQFNSSDEMIAMKISHSYHVAELAKILGKRLELTEENINLVKTIGLLHDIGRFVQYEKTKSYNDATTKIDHGKVATDYLFKEGHIKDFDIPEKYYSIIEKSIYNHNKLEIETDLTEEELFYVHLIRDADKIDIFRQEAAIENKSFIEPISPKIKEAFLEHHLIDLKEVKTKSDAILVELAYVFDIHFLEAYELLNDEQKILVFIEFGREKFIPKIHLPFYDIIPMQSLEEFEYITEINREKERLETVNNRLKKTMYMVQNLYYAKACELTEEMKNNIIRYCENNVCVPEFLSIEEIEEALKYIKENYEDARRQESLEQSLHVLKRKLNYEEY